MVCVIRAFRASFRYGPQSHPFFASLHASLESGNNHYFHFPRNGSFFPTPAVCPPFFSRFPRLHGPWNLAWSVVFDDDPELGELLDLALGDANAEAAAAAGQKRRMMAAHVAAVASMNAPGGQGPRSSGQEA